MSGPSMPPAAPVQEAAGRAGARVAAPGIGPVSAAPVVVSPRGDDGSAAVRVVVSPDEPVFAGHYPDFPIFPGVCVVECAHRGALATAPEPVELSAVHSARFTGPAFPGDVLDFHLKWRRRDGGWQVSATAVTARGDAASMRLRYRSAGTEPEAPAPLADAVPVPDRAEAGLPEVTSLLPHRYPMLLVDRITALRPGERITAVKAITHNEPWYAGLAPGQDLAYPESLLVESWGQSAGLLASAAAPQARGQVMLFGSVSNAVFHRPVLPGDLIEHRVTLTRSLGDSVIFEGESRTCAGPVMSVGQMVMAFRPGDHLRPS
ncbi:3-hydroxyacyl-ACP dehydratase FabZ family protein [Streptomyces sp. NPDC017966]|uniref:3-hydroxyacyl-ACP dehydratase FabZ family protein n=1 Tax=Streptomyces sp. NPDC017966 TaxID=3365023 RepID=UPI0037AE3F53